jgi:hypothetical protein
MDCDMLERTADDTDETENHCAINVKYKSGKAPTDEQCGKKSMIFVQYACELNGGQARRQVEGLFVACVTVLVYFFSVVYFDYVKTVEETNFVDFDVKTITAGDYTMEFDLLKVDG